MLKIGKGAPLVVRLWPDAGRALGLSRNGTYEAARRGEIKTLRFGRLRKVPTAWLLEMCGQSPRTAEASNGTEEQPTEPGASQ
jgi:hypothetical protein